MHGRNRNVLLKTTLYEIVNRTPSLTNLTILSSKWNNIYFLPIVTEKLQIVKIHEYSFETLNTDTKSWAQVKLSKILICMA